MDWTLWMLVALALASALFCAQAVRARMSPRRNGAITALAIAALLVGYAVTTYLQNTSRLAEVLELVGDRGVHWDLLLEARSELSRRVAFSIVAAMPALVLGIGFLGPRRSAPKG